MISDDILQTLRETAKRASDRAYCPYSRFPVGAAVLTDGGVIISGCNVENASYGLTICAERNAIFQAVAQGQTKILAVVIYTPTDLPTAPCGACRQVINEFGPDAEIFAVCAGEGVFHSHLSALLPVAFGPANLS